MNQTQKGIAMERIYAYRLLGLREGASQKQIDAAYDERRRKYKSPDYQDEPEYAARKMRELQEAYIMLGGSAPKAAAAAVGGNAAEKLPCLLHIFGSRLLYKLSPKSPHTEHRAGRKSRMTRQKAV